jgi:hypothetical protein
MNCISRCDLCTHIPEQKRDQAKAYHSPQTLSSSMGCMNTGDLLQPGNTNIPDLTEEMKQHYTKAARFEVLTAVTMQIIVFWNMTLRSVVNVYQTTSHHISRQYFLAIKNFISRILYHKLQTPAYCCLNRISNNAWPDVASN